MHNFNQSSREINVFNAALHIPRNFQDQALAVFSHAGDQEIYLYFAQLLITKPEFKKHIS